MPAIISLKTNLKSLGYGDDRPGGASSNQPYIQSLIPEGRKLTSPDFLLRNGYLNPVSSLEDVSRLTKYFTDVKSPNGLLFVAKQELLERQNVNVSDGINRIYNPLGTIAQAGVLSIGYHLNKQGFNVFREGYYTGGRLGYFTITNTSNILGEDKLSLLFKSKISDDISGFEALAGKNLYGITPSLDTVNLLSYPGGPGSFLGIGKTNIRIQNKTRPVKPTVEDNKFIPNFYNVDFTDPLYLTPGANFSPFSPGWTYRLFNSGVSAEYISTLNDGTENTRLRLNASIFSLGDDKNVYLNRNINENILESKNDPFDNQFTLDYNQMLQQDSRGKKQNTGFQNILDFRKIINSSSKNQLLPSTDYSQFNRENKINTGNGAKGYGTSVTTYKGNFKPDVGQIFNPNEAISPDQTELGVTGEDIIDLNFTIDDPNIDAENRLVDFRAYIESWSDGAKADWSPIKYMGRAESFYKYNGFSRDVSITFLVPALSRADMVNNYKKLNALIWTVAPSYSTREKEVVGLMRGSITKFTMGDYFNGMPCIIKSVDFTEIEGMGWDINRDQDGKIFDPTSEYYTGQLPKGIRVQVSMTPLHNFVPQYGEAFIGWDGTYGSSIYTLPKSGKGFWKETELNSHTAGYKFPNFAPRKIITESPTATISTPEDITGGTVFNP
jgi:hypothetical protein